MTRITYLGLLPLLFLGQLSHAQGFDGEYEIWKGDFDFNGSTDFLVIEKERFAIIHGDIATPIKLPTSVAPFILQRNPDATYTISPGGEEVDLQVWEPLALRANIRDANFDGALDMQLLNIGDVDASAVEQLVLASTIRNEIPFHAAALTDDVLQFQTDVASWAWDHNYFEDNAPEVPQQQPSTAVWFAVVLSPTDVFSINRAIAECELLTGETCATSFEPPNDCIKLVNIFDSFGNFLGTSTMNVCVVGALHIYAYLPGSVVLVKDYSVFNQDALDFVNEILSVSPQGIPDLDQLSATVLENLNVSLAAIIFDIFRGAIWDNGEDGSDLSHLSFTCDTDNSFQHVGFPGDGEVDSSDLSYHHFDVDSFVCDVSESNCSGTKLYDDVLRSFSYPSEGLQPRWTSLDGTSTETVYVAINPLNVHRPEKYTFEFGLITQRALPSGHWAGAIENTTLPLHFVYPGKIYRHITDARSGDASKKHIFTHGIGISRVLNFSALPPSPLNVLFACANDVFGKKAFETLDRVATDYWESEINQGSGQSKITPPPQPAYATRG
jgi:hypothetical protein